MTGRIEKLRQKHDLDINWVAFPLHPEIPEEGRSLQELFKGRDVDIPAMLARLKQVAREEGLSFGERTMTCNSRLAQELGKWAEEKGSGDLYHKKVFEAYFAEGKNIGLIEELLAVARACGLSPDEAREVLAQRKYRDAVDLDWERSRR
ncbi:MAG: DsbA family protein, partial [Desulfohalobiaceae bacterium]|nr:DsbA family protein [Desulfohalobiaceae bacterium]